MSDVFNHCTKCGGELNEKEQQLAEEHRGDIPPICTDCVRDMVGGMMKAFAEIQSVFVESFTPDK